MTNETLELAQALIRRRSVTEFGPVNRSIHKLNEAVAVEELEPLSEIYCRCLEAWLDVA